MLFSQYHPHCTGGLKGLPLIRKFSFLFVWICLNLHPLTKMNGHNNLDEFPFEGINPGKLRCYSYCPTQECKSERALPLVVVLHGCTQNAASLSRSSGWNKLAETYGFFLLYPEQRFANNPNGCFNWFRENDIVKNRGEVASLSEMIASFRRVHNVDSSRIFVYGLSAGAAMAVALMADYPWMFRKGAVLAGGAFHMVRNPIDALFSMSHPGDYPPEELAKKVREQNPDFSGGYPELILMHGLNDKVVDDGNSHLLIRQWASLNQADAFADSTERNFQGIPEISRYFYFDSQHKPFAVLYEVRGLGHALMVDPGEGPQQGGETGLFSVDRNFFSTWWIAKDFGLIPEP